MEKGEVEKNIFASDGNRDRLIYDSRCLFGEKNEILIKHQGAFYRLRITKNGKLIMNK